jgi:hypothetical protein
MDKGGVLIKQEVADRKKEDPALGIQEEHAIPIWFFVGSLLAVYGVLIFGAGIIDAFSPQQYPVTLSHLHAGIWWGLLLMAIGGFYCYKFRPSRNAFR